MSDKEHFSGGNAICKAKEKVKEKVNDTTDPPKSQAEKVNSSTQGPSHSELMT